MRHREVNGYPNRRIAHLKHDEKLSVEQVDEIRRRYRHHSRDANCRVLAEEFGVSATTIHNIVREKKWRFGDWQFRDRSLEPRNNRYVPTQKAHRSLERLSNGLITVAPSKYQLTEMYERILKLAHPYEEKAKIEE
ncbi:hypothetical protein [Anderseniella sp. Alg231-50]|uniref:hypothetical protein n=1 Tax=Anderseniella sp. Alg231-50 TaxID=1922226 RepID=UPI00307B1D16